MLAQRRHARSAADTPDPSPADRCPHQQAFNRATVDCPAFQALPFVAATSYGKPLGTHVACAHLQSGELKRGQFYPRCGLGAEWDRFRWIAMLGPARIEVVRAIQAEFETVCARHREALVASKAQLLRDSSRQNSPGDAELTRLIRDFLSDIDAFITAHADRIAHAGLSPSHLRSLATRLLVGWRRSRRLDLPAVDERWVRPADAVSPGAGEEFLRTPGLLICRTTEPPAVSLFGEIDDINLDSIRSSFDAARVAGAPVTVDLSGVTFCSVSGLRLLVGTARSGELRLRGAPPHMLRALSAAGWAGTIPAATRAGGEAA